MSGSTIIHVNRAIVVSVGGWLLTLALLVLLVRDPSASGLRTTVLRVLALSLAGRIVDDAANPYEGGAAVAPGVQALFAVASSAWLLPLALLSVDLAAQASSATLAAAAALAVFVPLYALFAFQQRVAPLDEHDAQRSRLPFAHWSAVGTLLSAPLLALFNVFLYAAVLHFPLVAARCGDLGLSRFQCPAETVAAARAALPTEHFDGLGLAVCDAARLYGSDVFVRSALLVLGSLLLWYPLALARLAVRLVLPSSADRLFCETWSAVSLLWYVARSLAEAPLLVAVVGGVLPRAWLLQYVPLGIVDAFSIASPMRVAIDLQEAALPYAEQAFAFATGQAPERLMPELAAQACVVFDALNRFPSAAL